VCRLWRNAPPLLGIAETRKRGDLLQRQAKGKASSCTLAAGIDAAALRAAGLRSNRHMVEESGKLQLRSPQAQPPQ
jgi:hypothetical protein